MIHPKKITTLGATLMLAGITLAQNPAPINPDPPAPVPVPAPAAVDPAAPAPEVVEIKEDEAKRAMKEIKGSIEQPAMTGDIMASLYRTWTGKRVIVSQAAQAKTISFIQPGPLTYEEAARLLEKAALLEGLAFVPSGPNEVKLLVAGNSGKNGPPLITQIEDLPEGEQLVTFVMTLENIKPEEAMNIFQGATKGLSEGGVIIPVLNTSSLIITENSALIKKLYELKEKIDKPQDLAVRRIITLEHADAEEVAEMVTTFMEFSAQQNTRFSTTQGGGGQQAGQAPGSRGSRNQQTNNRNNAGGESFTSVQILAEPRTNRIFVMGRPIDIEFAMSMIKDIDAPISRRNLYKHKLSFLSVSDFLPIAQNAIELATANNAAAANGAGGAGGAGRGNTGGNTGANQGGENQAANASDRAASSLDDSNRLEYPESILIGKTLLVADNANNSLIVQGPPQSISVVRDLIKEMDVSSDQVQITAVFGRYSLGKELNFGVDFGRTFQKTRGANSGFALQNRTNYPLLVDPSTLDSVHGQGTPPVGGFDGLDPSSIAGLSLYGQIGKHFFPTLQALEGTGRFKLLARPKVFTTNNRKAILSSGQSIAVPTNSLSTNTGVGGNVSQSTNIAYRDVLLKLEVVPLVNNKDEVTLQISFINDNIVGNQLIDGNEVPTIGKEEILTTVTVPNGETVVLGGLITERDEKTVSGIPILSSIPGIGKIFSSTQTDKNREELVIFIKPQIVGSRAQLDELQEYNQEESDLAREIQSEGVLPTKDAGVYPADTDPAPVASPRKDRFRGIRR